MLVEEWMKHPVRTVKLRDSIEHARALMQEHRINQLPVVHDGELKGIVTDRDLRDAYPSIFDIVRSAGKKSDGLAHPEAIEVEAVMTANTLSVAPGNTMTDAATIMRAQRVGALPVVDNGSIVGIVTRSDVLAAFVELEGKSGA